MRASVSDDVETAAGTMSEAQPPTRELLPGTSRLDEHASPDTLTVDDPLTRSKGEPDALGQAFGRFEIVDVLGSGGMGSVFEARDTTLDRPVALKLLHPDVAISSQKKLLREAKALAKISHPHVVQIFEAGVVGERSFIAMQLVRGQDLSRWQRPDRGWRRCVEVYIQAARGLAAAHAEGIVHRDFKPSNCILDESGRVRVVDFGLARPLGPISLDVDASDASVRIPGGAPALRAIVAGTLGYMSLEQLWRQPLDAKSDQFAFCVSLFEAIHGQRPFSGPTLEELIDAMIQGRIEWTKTTPPVPRRLTRMLRRGLDAQPARRWPTMHAVIDELEAVLHPPSRRAWWGLTAATVGALGVGGTLWALTPEPCDVPQEEWSEARADAIAQVLAEADESLAASVPSVLARDVARWNESQGRLCQARDENEREEAALATWQRCLDEQRATRSRLEQLIIEPGADPEVAAAAASRVDQLESPTICEDPERFAPRHPLPEDPTEAERARALWLEVDRSQVLASMGRIEDATEVIDRALVRAEELGYGPLWAEVELVRGGHLAKVGQLEEAKAQLEVAYARAVEHEHRFAELRSANALAYVAGDLLHEHEAGLKWGLTAEALGRQPWVPAALRIYSFELLGNVYYEQGRFAEALERYRGALEDRLELDPDTTMVSLTLSNIGLVLHEQGHYAEALPYFYEVLERREHRLGPQHPAVAHAVATVASSLSALGQNEHARDLLWQALLITEREPTKDEPEQITVLVDLGLLELRDGDLTRAWAYFQRALEAGSRVLGPEHVLVARSWLGLAQVLAEHGLLDAAERHARRGLELVEARVGPRHPTAAEAAVILGEIEAAGGDVSRARDHLERAIEVFAASEGPAARLGRARFALAQLLLPLPTEREAALAMADRARHDLEREPEEAAEIEGWLLEARAEPLEAPHDELDGSRPPEHGSE